jgi:hypothetical protein
MQYIGAVTDGALDAKTPCLLAEQALLAAHARLRLTPNDRAGHASHHERLNAHLARVRAFKDALHAFHQRRSST